MNNMENIEEFTHGIMAVNPNRPDEDGNIEILHFVGYWEEPNEDDIIGLWEELKENEEFGMQEHVDEIELRPAPMEIVEYYNSVVQIQDNEEDEESFN